MVGSVLFCGEGVYVCLYTYMHVYKQPSKHTMHLPPIHTQYAIAIDAMLY